MSMTATDLAKHFGMRVEDVNDVLTNKEDATQVSRRLGIAPVVASALVTARTPRKAASPKSK